MTSTSSDAHRRVFTATATGRQDTRLGLRDHYGRGIAIVGQDVIRRNVLREHDTARGAHIALLGKIAREALDAGFHVVLEGILYADRYGHMITSARHASKADAAYLAQVTDSHLTSWYRKLDLLPGGLETVVPADSTLQATIARILRETDLAPVYPIPPQYRPSQGDAMNPLVSTSPTSEPPQTALPS